MFGKPFVWKWVLMPGSLAFWAFAVAGFFIPFEEPVRIAWLIVLPIWAILHPLELIVSYGIGRGKGVPAAITIVKTVLFGFTWWLPLKLGVIDK